MNLKLIGMVLLCVIPLSEGLLASDAKAMALADKVVEAMGGQKNYDETRYISFRFFGRRLHVWDKWTGKYRYENKDLIVLMDVNSKQGKAWDAGVEITDEAELKKALEGVYAVWINDFYWLVMPFKLKDPGVNLTYTREDKTEAGADAHVLTMTFDNVGLTPQNKYEIFIDKSSNLVTQWSFFTKAEDEKARFTMPWANWKPYGKILLNDNFGERAHSELAVHETLPESVFNSPEAINLTAE